MKGMGTTTVDVHSHFFPAAFLRLVQEEGPSYGARGAGRGGERSPVLVIPGHPQVSLTPQFVEVEARVKALDAVGIDTQALLASASAERAFLRHAAFLAGDPGGGRCDRGAIGVVMQRFFLACLYHLELPRDASFSGSILLRMARWYHSLKKRKAAPR